MRAATMASSSGLAGFTAAACTDADGTEAEGAAADGTDDGADATRAAAMFDKAA